MPELHGKPCSCLILNAHGLSSRCPLPRWLPTLLVLFPSNLRQGLLIVEDDFQEIAILINFR